MAAKSTIEWLGGGGSWTPILARDKEPGEVGKHCEKVSEACRHCYAERTNKRRLPNNGTGLAYTPENRKNVDLFLDEKMLLAPLKWRKPRKIFVCSTTDLFGEWVPDEWLDRIFAVMAPCPQHTWILLTKRSARMREYCSDPTTPERIATQIFEMPVKGSEMLRPLGNRAKEEDPSFVTWPLPNVWLGVTAENQAMADTRIPELLATPAAVRWVSIEPMIGPIDLNAIDVGVWIRDRTKTEPHPYDPIMKWPLLSPFRHMESGYSSPGLDWIVAGGESGPGARDTPHEWYRSLRDQCKVAGVPFYLKQITERGRKLPIELWPADLVVREFPEAPR